MAHTFLGVSGDGNTEQQSQAHGAGQGKAGQGREGEGREGWLQAAEPRGQCRNDPSGVVVGMPRTAAFRRAAASRSPCQLPRHRAVPPRPRNAEPPCQAFSQAAPGSGASSQAAGINSCVSPREAAYLGTPMGPASTKQAVCSRARISSRLVTASPVAAVLLLRAADDPAHKRWFVSKAV